MSNHKGIQAEIMFLAWCFHNKLTVSLPYGDFSQYDFIVDSGPKLYRVQVKGVHDIKQSPNGSYQVALLRDGEKRYTQVDVIVVCFYHMGILYMFPTKDVPNKYIRVNPLKENSWFAQYRLQKDSIPDWF